MATAAQIHANRLNAQKSTGPRSVQGKAASSRNAWKTGIHVEAEIARDESAEDLQKLLQSYLDEFQPESALERCQVDIAVRSEWLLRRFARVEIDTYELQIKSENFRHYGKPMGVVYVSLDAVLERLQRRITSTQRALTAALKELERLKTARVDAPRPSETAAPALQIVEKESAYPEIGFVPSAPPVTPPHNPAILPAAAGTEVPAVCVRMPREMIDGLRCSSDGQRLPQSD